jgi:cell wall-associated NlpC family hydrolase
VLHAVQNTFAHRLHLSGWAYDPARPRASVVVRFYVRGELVGRVRADEPSADVDARFAVSGRHRFTVTLGPLPWAGYVTAKTRGVGGPLIELGRTAVTHYYPPAGERLIYLARKYVGSRYVEGGDSPAGFDCSGYTQYVYEHARVHRLAHNAETQRRTMRRITRAQARPGDLVFYLSGGSAYHVAVYAGRGWQYAAATVRDGVRFQPVWSSNVQYGTDWH